ncbi:MAG: glycoside hydrolase family 99-like domain-containing protein [Bacteroidales bacterium]|nr:glycoside hydrolase family 99-like domain-containing protein [Bacteroidales bacterium]
MKADSKRPKARVLAYYLPQFHPIPENDEWWGKGFTEWTNVGKAKPLFPGHYQPHVPADLGYYDLRVPETREAQAQMAREAGVEGFVYWHYWFGNGKRLLERPFNEVLTSGKPDFPFALAWANETWSGSLHGLLKGKTLIEQQYPGDEDYINHFKELLPAFKDRRYLTCEGRLLFFIYHPEQMPDVAHFIHLWQNLSIEHGIKEFFFVALTRAQFVKDEETEILNHFLSLGFSAIAPLNVYYCPKLNLKWKLCRKIFYKTLKCIPNVIPYDIETMQSPMDDDKNVFPMVYPGWDHTPRSGKRGVVVCGNTPQLFEKSVLHAVNKVSNKPEDRNIIMLKSWNEWAEGNYMEPDLKWGKKYLEALKRALY